VGYTRKALAVWTLNMWWSLRPTKIVLAGAAHRIFLVVRTHMLGHIGIRYIECTDYYCKRFASVGWASARSQACR
jgi:hypothetical protein